MKRKLISLALCLCLILTLLPAGVYAAGEPQGLYYRRANVDTETNPWTYTDSHRKLRDEMADTPGFSQDVVLVYIDENGTEVIPPFNEVTATGDYFRIEEPAEGFVTVYFTDFGDGGYISYEGWNLPVRSDVPDYGFFKALPANQQNYIARWDYDENNTSIYFAATGEEDTFLSIEEDGSRFNAQFAISQDGKSVEIRLGDVSCGSGDLKIQYTVKNGDEGTDTNSDSIWVDCGPGSMQDDRCHSESFTINGNEAVVGFAFVREDGMLDPYVEGNSGPSCSYEQETNGSYGEEQWDLFDYPICVGKVVAQEGGNTVYQNITDGVTLTVKVIRLEPADAMTPMTAFSLEKGTAQVTSKSAPIGNPPSIYYNKSYEGAAKVCATVEVNGTEYEIWYTVTTEFDKTTVIDLTEAASIHEINQTLSGMSKSSDPVEIILGAKTYGDSSDDANIILPDLSDSRSPSAITVRGTEKNGVRTKVDGGLMILSTQGVQISGIDFQAREQGRSFGISGSAGAGPCNVYDCSFRNFETAIDATKSFVGATAGNQFHTNTVALDIALPDSGSNQDQLEGNVFTGNGTAVRVTALNDFVTPYYFRLRDGEFVGNDVDLDISQEGEYYFYRNLFAADESTLREPVIGQHDGVIIHCYPARDFDGNLILSKSENNVILNDMAGQLQIGVSQLQGQKMTIVSDNGSGSTIVGFIESILAAQNVFSTSAAGLRMASSSSEGEGFFTPSLDVTRTEDAVSVVLQDVPAGLKLAVSIPEIGWKQIKVTHGGKTLEEVSLADGMATFVITEGGEYVIAEKTQTYRIVDQQGKAVEAVVLAETKKVEITGSVSPAEPVLVASYDGDGRFLGLKAVTEAGQVAVGENADTVGIFWIDAENAPKGGSDTIRLTE